ncbi:PAS domain S-box protein [Natrarchaeobius chitinivorans]|uniref:histidine kinase n=1 Tax=Natrarchaeobius chitinivorans TaxID=1679083 RepID=A0A3N6NGD2_NATCH|nr:PAS domain S-box protein [Natrarchaeobius chitinivorans]RQG98082.1 PAS domain S-box protein [Natrarchaeobius chitinivorans]
MSTRADANGEGGTLWADVDDDVALDRYRTLAETMGSGIYQLDADGRFVAVNDAVVETTGYARDELLGEHVSLILSGDAPDFESTVSTPPESGDGETATFELAVRTADGQTVLREFRITTLVESGEFRGTIGVSRDGTESIGERATADTETPPYGPITNVLGEANIGVFVLTDEFDVAWADETIEEYFGLDRSDVLGRDKRTLIEESVKDRFADPDRFADTVLATYDDNSYVERFECRITAGEDRDGRWLEHYSRPIESGQYAGGRIEFYDDITDQKRSEGVLRETRERFHSLIDAVEEYAIFRLDPGGHVVSWNEGAGEIKGYDTEEILGEHFSTFYTPQDRAEGVPDRNLEKAADEGSITDEGWRVRKDGSRFWADVTITAVYDDGTHRGFLKVTRDTTDRYEREQELETELQRIFGRITDGFYALDEECQFTHCNERAEEILGVDWEELLGSNVWDEFPELEGTAFETTYQKAMETQESVSFEEYYRPTDAWFEVHVYPSETGLSVYFRDVSDRVERERELERTERRFEAIFNDPNILVGLLAPDGTVLDINGTAMEYIDAGLEDVTGESFWETPWWGEGDAVQSDVKEWTKRAAAGEYVDFETDLTRPNGERYTLSGYFRPVTNDDGDVVSIIVSDRDVTDRKRRERQLRKSEQRYRTLAENFPNGIVTMFDDDLEYTLAAGRGFEDLPVSSDDVEGESVDDVWPEDVSRVLASAFRAALDGERQVVEPEYAGREWVVRVVPLTDDDGNAFGGMTLAQDITDRKERKRALAESKRRYQTLVDHFPNGAVGLYDETLSYTIVGGSLLDELGIASEDVVGSSIYDRYPDEIVEQYGHYFDSVFEGESNAFELEYHDRHLQAHTLPVRNTDGEIDAGMLMVQDVTERKEYERKLEASNERLEQFAYAISHDLQEPLRMVSSYLQLVDDRYADELDEDAEEFIEFAVDGADRMREMIEALLEYSRVETEGDPLEPTDLDGVLEDAIENLHLQIEDADAEITAEDLPRVRGDAGQLRQVFQNILSNAIEYSGDEPPRITVSAEREDGQCVVSIRDRGIGIDPEDQERVFDVFERLHNREDHPGTGVGLALCQRIVERHGGDIWVDSEPGAGATFSFTLPTPE